jgi:hypothetical protein
MAFQPGWPTYTTSMKGLPSKAPAMLISPSGTKTDQVA